MIERKGRGNAIPNSKSADLSTLPSKNSKAWECCRSMKPFWIICGCSVVIPLPSVRVLLTGIGGNCTQLLLRGGSLPTAGGHEQHLEAQEP